MGHFETPDDIVLQGDGCVQGNIDMTIVPVALTGPVLMAL